MTKKIAVFCSGSGSNAEELMSFFQHRVDIQVTLMVVNKKGIQASDRAKKYQVPVMFVNREDWQNESLLIAELKKAEIDFIVLAGFLWKIPSKLIQTFPHKIINIHPALLPKYGGQGMYGHHVHQAVIANKEELSGITIHLVDEEYDHGRMLLQATCEVQSDDTAQSLASRIHALEHTYYKIVVEQYILQSV